MIARDFKALEAMLHGDLLYTHSSGVTDTKATWLQSMQSGKTKYKSVNCTDRKVRVIGEVALVTGRAAIEAEIGGQPRSLKLLFLNAWAKTPQGWKFVAWQSDPARGLSEGFKGRADLPVEQPHQLRVGHQSEDCERPRANDYSRVPVACRRGDRIPRHFQMWHFETSTVRSTAAFGGNPDIEQTSPNDQV